MASSHVPIGRGHLRQRTHMANSFPTDASSPTIPTTADVNACSTSVDVQPYVRSQMTDTGGRGRGSRLKREVEISDPHWKISDLTNQQFQSNARPSRPIQLGTIGQPFEVIVNYFLVHQYPQQGLVYQYHFDVQNRRKTNITGEQRRALYESWLYGYCQKYPQITRHSIAFDNQNIVITYNEPLPDIDASGIQGEIKGRNRRDRYEEYQITIKRVGNSINLNSLCSLEDMTEPQSGNNRQLNNIRQVLSIVLHERCSSQADYIHNRTFFTQPSSKNSYGYWDLGLGKAAWRGFYSCLLFRKGAYQLLMNLDVSHAVFQKKQSFLDFLCEVMFHSPCGKWQYPRHHNVQKADMNDVLNFLNPTTNSKYYGDEIEFLLKHCKHFSVRTHVSNKTIGYHIDSFGEPASTQTFKWTSRNNELITVENYYKENYAIELKNPLLPTVKMHNGSFVPMEFIDVEPVRVKKITDEQRALLCLKSSLTPPDYWKSIKEVRNDPNQQCFENDPFVAAWNLSVDVNMHKVPARVLTPPKIIVVDENYPNHQHSSTSSASDINRASFYQPTRFPSVWALINLSSSLDQKSCKTFCDQLEIVAADRGISCRQPVLYKEYDLQQQSVNQMIAALKEMMEKNDDCQFFIVILPENDAIRNGVYGELKKLCELEYGLGIVTQMIKIDTRQNKNQWNYSKLNNILKKINTKLNGINSILSVPAVIERFFTRGHHIMYVGIDLSHGAPGLSQGRSTVAVVASADDIPNRYFKEIYMQERPAEAKGESWESVVDMKQIMKSLISQYDQHRGFPPSAIVIYRDGIADSEFDGVFEKELTATREACVALSVVYRPHLTYIVVNKRHHTRFFPTNSDGNVMSGTVVDSPDVTNPGTYNFFLNSHHSRLGTSRPTHYHVLYDDNKLKPDEVQMLTYALCHTSARFTGAISIPAPVQYADLLAFRANFYININDSSNRTSPSSQSSTPSNQSGDGQYKTKSTRIVLSAKLEKDSPFFL